MAQSHGQSSRLDPTIVEAPLMRRGMTLLEITITMVVLAIVAAVILPAFDNGNGSRIAAAMILLRDDLEQARYRTVANPNQARALLFDDDGRGWRVVDPADPSLMLQRDDGSDWYVRSGEARGAGMRKVEITLDGVDGLLLAFDASGALRDRSAIPSIHVSCGQQEQVLEIGAVTGIVRISSAD